MEIDLGPRAEAFRRELREWLAETVPDDREERRALMGSPRWAELLLEQRLICVAWPEDYGGRGLTGVEVAVLNEEFARVRARRVTRGMGESLVGPSIIVHGTDEQQARLLPRIIDGTDRYCQGFSEPDAGSDLASLSTRAVVDGDELVIDGQKVWTSWYTDATIVFTLCRTDADAPKHRGISYVLVPVDQPGVEFRPIKQITGERHFAETWFTAARAPLDNVIGGLNNGWAVSMTTLGNERGGGATTQYIQHERMFWNLVDEVRRLGRDDDPLVRERLAWFWSHVAIMRFQGLRLLSALASDNDPGPSASMNKMFWSEHQQRLTEYAVEVLGPSGTLRGPWTNLLLGSRSHTIWGGTAEIQRNIAGERVLGLPKEPSAGEDG